MVEPKNTGLQGEWLKITTPQRLPFISSDRSLCRDATYAVFIGIYLFIYLFLNICLCSVVSYVTFCTIGRHIHGLYVPLTASGRIF